MKVIEIYRNNLELTEVALMFTFPLAGIGWKEELIIDRGNSTIKSRD